MTDSYAAIAAKPNAVAGVANPKKFSWAFLLNCPSSDIWASISVIAVTLDEARQQVLDLLAKIVPLAAEKNSLGDYVGEAAYNHVRDLRQKVPASLELDSSYSDIFDYTEDLIVWDKEKNESRLGDFIRNTLPQIRPFNLVTFSCHADAW